MAERRFQFWENFYRPLTRIRDRAARAELALKLLEAAFEDEPPVFDDMEGLVADAVVPLILKDVGGKRPGRPKKGDSRPVGIPGGEGESFPETISETISKTVSKTVSEGPYKAKLKVFLLKRKTFQQALRAAQARRVPRRAQGKASGSGPDGRRRGAAAGNAGGTWRRRRTAPWRAPRANPS